MCSTCKVRGSQNISTTNSAQNLANFGTFLESSSANDSMEEFVMSGSQDLQESSDVSVDCKLYQGDPLGFSSDEDNNEIRPNSPCLFIP